MSNRKAILYTIYFLFSLWKKATKKQPVAAKESRVKPSKIAEPLLSFEHKTALLLSRKKYYLRVGRHIIAAILLLWMSLYIWVLWYHYLWGLPRVDSLLNASMILWGMGPVDILHTSAAKIFASFYALYSGMLLLSIFSLVLAPVIHRVFHKVHLGE